MPQLKNNPIPFAPQQLYDWKVHGHNGTLILDYSVQVAGKYLDRQKIQELWDLLSDEDKKKILSETGRKFAH